jgi:hypothetical protein
LVVKIIPFENNFVVSLFDLSLSKHVKYVNPQNDQPILYSLILFDPTT